MAISYFNDQRFMNLVTALIVKDRQFLRTCHHLLDAKDFKPKGIKEPQDANRWTVCKLALDHYERYREPIKDMLSAEILDHCRKNKLNGSGQVELVSYAKKLLKKKVVAADSIADKIIQFKRERRKAAAVEEMIELQGRGELTDEAWLELSRKAIESMTENPYYVSDYFDDEELSKRIDRRRSRSDNRFPFLLIEGIDTQVRAIAKGHLGLVMAPYKRGKSLMLIWIAVAYVLQRLNVLFITLEDPPQDVEDRFDACITNLPINKLQTMPKTLRDRFRYFKRLIRSRLKIVDRTEHKTTVRDIEAIYEDERNKGFIADAIIVDYDDEVAASKKNNERRLEMADIYRDFRQLASRRSVLLWTAAQSKRATAMKKQLGGDDLAEDISKIRKVAMALSLGAGDWGPDSIYLWVAAHKFDKQHCGANIMTDKKRMMIYDRVKTKLAKKNPEMYIQNPDGEEVIQ